jgi:pilus assembly protein Flp/PilA
MKSQLARFVRDEEGQDLIEYGLLAGIITAAVVGFITTIGTKVSALFSGLASAVSLAP